MAAEDPMGGMPGVPGSEDPMMEGPPPKPEEEPIDPSQAEPDSGAAMKLELTPEQEVEIARYIVESLQQHDSSMEKRWKKQDRIADSYEMEFDPVTGGVQPNAARGTSEFTKNFCDQANARISGQLVGSDPIFAAKPIGMGESDPQSMLAQQMADSTVTFLHNYGFGEMNLGEWLPDKGLVATKYGMAVTRDMWVERLRKFRYFDQMGELQTEEIIEGRIECPFIHYRDFILWPVWITDWQRDYEMVGHRVRLSEWRFREEALKWGVSDEDIEDIIIGAKGGSEKEAERTKRHGITISEGGELDKMIEVTEVWIQGAPKGLPADKYQFIVQEDTWKLLYYNYNPLNSQKHPYWPFIYKKKDGIALGEGVGHEVYPMQRADSALYNLELDNAKVVGNNVILVSEEANLEAYLDDLHPGKRLVAAGDLDNAMKALELGAPIEMIHIMQDRTYRRAVASTGMSALLQGMGDPVMKSGQDVGTSLALIEEGAKKFGRIDDSIKKQFSGETLFWLELIQQYASTGLFYNKLPEHEAQLVEQIKYIPPRGRLEDVLKIDIIAPSASTNKAAQRQQLMLMQQLSAELLQECERLATEVYASEGLLALIVDYKRQILTFRMKLFNLLIEVHDSEKIMASVPKIRPPLPAEQQISVLMQQIIDLQQQLEQYQMQEQEWELQEGAEGEQGF
jgi:hypothetical protein